MGFKGARVINVTPGGWAERQGVMINDEIAEVGGTGFSNLSDEQKIELFKRPRPFEIKFKRPARLRKQQVAKEGPGALSVPGLQLTATGEVHPSMTAIVGARTQKGGSAAGFLDCLCCRPAADTSNDISVARRRTNGFY
eukprot:g17938.t1